MRRLFHQHGCRVRRRCGSVRRTTAASPWRLSAGWPGQRLTTGDTNRWVRSAAGRRQRPRHEAVWRGSGPERTREPAIRAQWRIGIEAAGLGNHQSWWGHPNPRRHRCHQSSTRSSSVDLPTMRRPRDSAGKQMTAGQDPLRATRRNAVTGGRAATRVAGAVPACSRRRFPATRRGLPVPARRHGSAVRCSAFGCCATDPARACGWMR